MINYKHFYITINNKFILINRKIKIFQIKENNFTEQYIFIKIFHVFYLILLIQTIFMEKYL
jgi:hypothetical protein